MCRIGEAAAMEACKTLILLRSPWETGGHSAIRAQLSEGQNEMVFLFFASSSKMTLALRQKSIR
jgi:hypothetical protein